MTTLRAPGRALFALCAIVPALAGCTETSQPSLTGAELVVVAGVQNSDLDWSPVKGALLVRHDGSTQRVVTDGMDNAKLVRTATGVAFSDLHHDFLLGDSLITLPRDEAGSLEVAAVLTDDGRVAAAFNNGDDAPGYRTDITRFDTTGTTLTSQFGLVPEGLAQCASGEYLIGIPNDDPFGKVSVQALDAQRETTLSVPFEPGDWPDRVSCTGDRVMGIVQDADHAGVAHAVVITVPQGKVSTHRLVGADGPALKLSDDDTNAGAIRPHTLPNGQLEWLGEVSGRVYHTDPASGRTSVVASGLPSGENERVVRFTDAGCDILARDDDDGGWRLLRYSADWELSDQQDLPWLAGELGDLWAYDFLVPD